MSRHETDDEHADVVWLDDETDPQSTDSEFGQLTDDDRPPIRRRTRVLLVLLAAAVLGAAVTVGVMRTDDEPDAAPSRPAASRSSTASAPVAPLPQRAPRSAIAAIRTEFPSAVLTSFSAVRQPETDGLYRIFNLKAGDRLIIVTVSPPRPGDTERVDRTATSVEIAQRLGLAQVSIQVRIGSGRRAPSASDYAGMQRLIQDTRLLALR